MHHVLKQLEIVAMHPRYCTMGKYKLTREEISGLFCNWVYYCDNCEKDFIVTSDPLHQKDEINDALSWGAMSVGIGYSQVEELFSVLDLPIMSQRKYTAHEAKVGKVRNPFFFKYVLCHAQKVVTIVKNIAFKYIKNILLPY